jgi:UDP-N-acetylmuramate dehydrogenase
VARFAATHGLEGAEFLAGIPGCVGGALAMNAGCYGSQTWDFVQAVQTIDRRGVLQQRARGEFELGYRHVALPGARLGEEEWFVEALFRFRRGDGARARARIRELLARRVASQPLGLPNAGSVFRNPPGDTRRGSLSAASRHSVGGARVSGCANFIVRPGGLARAADIEALMLRPPSARFGIDLIAEVRIVGEPLEPGHE